MSRLLIVQQHGGSLPNSCHDSQTYLRFSSGPFSTRWPIASAPDLTRTTTAFSA